MINPGIFDVPIIPVPINLHYASNHVPIEWPEESISGGSLKKKIGDKRSDSHWHVPKNRQIVVLLDHDHTAVEKIVNDDTMLSNSELANVCMLECMLEPVEVRVKVYWPIHDRRQTDTVLLRMNPEDEVSCIKEEIEKRWNTEITDSVLILEDGKEIDPTEPRTLAFHRISSITQVTLIIAQTEEHSSMLPSGAASHVDSDYETLSAVSDVDLDDTTSEPVTPPFSTGTVAQIIKKVMQQLVPDFKDVKETGRNLGRGAYGRVVEVTDGTTTFAAKIFRADFVSNDAEAVTFVDRFEREFKLISRLHKHRNVVPYCGISCLPDSVFPVLLMKKMEISLHEYLLRSYNPPLSDRTKIALLYGIASGLVFLHNEGVIHRDLTARNILLDEKRRPGISDFGNAHLFWSSQPDSMSSMPGTELYMPPEAHTKSYDFKLDVFSFGVLSLFVSTQRFPKVLLPSVYCTGSDLRARSEFECRKKYFDMLTPSLSIALLGMMKDCLHNDPKLRPIAEELKMTLLRLLEI